MGFVLALLLWGLIKSFVVFLTSSNTTSLISLDCISYLGAPSNHSSMFLKIDFDINFWSSAHFDIKKVVMIYIHIHIHLYFIVIKRLSLYVNARASNNNDIRI